MSRLGDFHRAQRIPRTGPARPQPMRVFEHSRAPRPVRPSSASAPSARRPAQLGGTPAVDLAVAAPRQARRLARHQKERDALLRRLPHRSCAPRRGSKSACRALLHDGLGARSAPSRSPRALGARGHQRRLVVRAGFVVRQRGDGAAVDQRAMRSFCASLPACAIARPTTSAPRNGSTTRPLPRLSKTTATSKPSPPKPPGLLGEERADDAQSRQAATNVRG